MNDVDSDGLEISLAVADEWAAGRPPLVFLHEGLGSVGLWRGFPERVRAATAGPTTLVYSRHGYGRSAPAGLPRPVTYMHHEADVVLPRLLERWGIETPILVGHSDGASIALLYAGAGRPIAGLVLLAPHVFVEDITIKAIAEARDTYERSDLRDRMARHHDDVDATFRGWNDVWLSPAFRSWSIEDRLASIAVPILLVQGDDDPYGSGAQLDAIEAKVAGATQRVVLPGVGHAPHLEAPETTLEAVAEFIAEIGANGMTT